MPIRRLMAAGIMLAAVSACGGGSAPTPTPVPAPQARHYALLASSPDETILFGGFTSPDAPASPARLSDTWRWSGGRWVNVTGTQQPDQSVGVMAYDSGAHFVVFYGIPGSAEMGAPSSGGKASPSTWLWSHDQWSGQSQSSGPSLSNVSMAYSATEGGVLLLGTTTDTNASQQLWVWKGAQWAKLWDATDGLSDAPQQITALPGGMVGGLGLAGDPLTGTGFVTKWTGDGWERLATVSGTPTSVGALAYDSGRAQLVVYGKRPPYDAPWQGYATFVFDGTSWSSVDSTPLPRGRLAGAMTYDEQSHSTLYFGGDAGDSSSVGATFGQSNDLWSWDGKAWTKISG